ERIEIDLHLERDPLDLPAAQGGLGLALEPRGSLDEEALAELRVEIRPELELGRMAQREIAYDQIEILDLRIEPGTEVAVADLGAAHLEPEPRPSGDRRERDGLSSGRSGGSGARRRSGGGSLLHQRHQVELAGLVLHDVQDRPGHLE